MTRIEKSVRNQVSHSRMLVATGTWSQFEHQVYAQVLIQVENRVARQVWVQIKDQILQDHTNGSN